MTNDTSTEPVTESAEALTARFAELAARWKHDTRFSTQRGRDAKHPACREIVAMGEKAIPLLLADLERNGDYWFLALNEITGADPVPDEDAGKIEKMEAAWLAWGHEQGYRWETTGSESDEALAARFAELAARWKDETRHSSKMKTIREHPAYRKILAMRKKAVPLILADLEGHERDSHLWFGLLDEITGADPVPTSERARIDELAAAWLAWGKAQGYRGEHAV